MIQSDNKDFCNGNSEGDSDHKYVHLLSKMERQAEEQQL